MFKKPTKKELENELEYFYKFYDYIKQNNYQAYCRAVEFATKN